MPHEIACIEECRALDRFRSHIPNWLIEPRVRERRGNRQRTALLLAELYDRQLYLGRGSSSLFLYCTHRFTCPSPRLVPSHKPQLLAIRSAHHVPDRSDCDAHDHHPARCAFDRLTTRLLLAPRHKSRKSTTRSSLVPQLTTQSTLRRLPADTFRPMPTTALSRLRRPINRRRRHPHALLSLHPRGAVVAPLEATAFCSKCLDPTHQNLERARALRRHQIPNGDPR